MRIRNNQGASFALRYTGKNNSALFKSLEKLSSGYAINRAGDDAAGLTISEKMRRQITGLKRADQNSREGSKLIQVGEGALDEIHGMLQRAASLANQSANGVYEDKVDREALQAELDQLCEDIDRISTSANFNGVKLFQNRGLKYEGGTKLSKTVSTAAQQAADVNRAQAAQTAPRRTLDDLIRDEDRGDLNIVYVEQTGALVTANPITGQGSSTLGMDKDITITNQDNTTTTRKLSDILKTEIVPNTVKQVLASYPAFSYLTGSTIGIGLELYKGSENKDMASALAYITIGYEKSADLNYANYTLGVNIEKLDTNNDGTITRDELVELEATISHEMIHAFMDEATTAGMIGFDPTDSTFKDGVKFPTWFIEGMAQTASGPGNWIYPKGYTGGGLQIDTTSTDEEIKNQINYRKLGTNVGGSGDYGTGYLACMYLGWKIASGGNAATEVNAANISMGLTSLMNAVIGGKSLDKAITELTGGAFASTSDFQANFNAAGTDVTGFVHNLMVAKGDGRGGLVSGNLTHKDLVPNDAVTDLKLFELDTAHSKVNNVYPSGYPVLSGGTVSGDNTKVPTDFRPAVTQKEYGDFIIKGNLPDDGSGGMQGITWDGNSNTLTVNTGSDIEITMKSPTSGTLQNLKLEGTGKVTLNGVTAGALQIDEETEVSYEGKNEITGAVTVASGKEVTFQGKGQLKAGTFINNGTVSFNGGAVIVDSGTGTIGGTVKVSGGSVAANITTPTGADGTTALKSIAVDWNKLPSGFDITSISIDGVKAGALLDNNDLGKLWLDPAKNHRVTFTDASGVSKTLAATINASGDFEWNDAIKPFTVNGGSEGTDYHYEDDGTTLVIDSKTALSISGGTTTDEAGNPLLGRIKLTDNISGPVNLTLDGVNCSGNTVGSGLDLGTGNTVILSLADGTENTFKGAANFAGISIGDNSNLTIDGSAFVPDDPDNPPPGPKAGKLIVTGGTNAAGIGRNNGTGSVNSAPNASITIKGGEIIATGGQYASAIGAGYNYGFGDISITGGSKVEATGGYGGSAIGGAYGASVGNILIDNKADVKAISTGHGAGIGGGWGGNASCGTITIEGDTKIYASSTEHGTGIGAGCSNYSGMITIQGNAEVEAIGGDCGAGIGSSWNASTKTAGVKILGHANVKAKGGNEGAGIGAGNSGSQMGTIEINTTGTVEAEGGQNGVGIGSGSQGSHVDDITITQGTVKAKGGTDSTGIGAGRGSTSSNITIGDKDNPNNKVIVTAEGGMTNNGGNIMSYTDSSHTQAGTVKIVGNGTTVRPGQEGEGLYSTSGVVGEDGNSLYAYPVYLFHTDGTTDKDKTLDAGVGLNAKDGTGLLPLDKDKVDLASITISSDEGGSWTTGLSHNPLDSDYVFVWLKPKNQKLTIEYDEEKVDADGNPVTGADGKPEMEHKSVELDLIYYPKSGVFRIETQPKPPDAVKPGYNVPDPKPTPDPKPDPDPPEPPKEEEPGEGGIILQIGAEYGEILTVPQFYLSLDALKMGNLDISTQPNAWESMPVIRNAINRVSSIRATYGALYNRLEHNQNQLRHMVENTTDAESRIRDADMAEEMMAYTKANILSQSAQAMLSQAAQQPQSVLQLLS